MESQTIAENNEDKRNRYWPAGPLVDRDQVADGIEAFARARAHANGAKAWADHVDHGHPDHAPARRRAHESAENAGTQLHALALLLFAHPDDALAHEDFVDKLDAALDDGFAAGWDGREVPEAFDVVGFPEDDQP